MGKSKNFAHQVFLSKDVLAEAGGDPILLRALLEDQFLEVQLAFVQMCTQRGWEIGHLCPPNVKEIPARCRTRAGDPKRCFISQEQAREAILEDGMLGEVKPYWCSIHGWHIGGVLTRELREIIHAKPRSL